MRHKDAISGNPCAAQVKEVLLCNTGSAPVVQGNERVRAEDGVVL